MYLWDLMPDIKAVKECLGVENVFRSGIFVSETEKVTDRMVSQLRHEGIRNYGNQIGRVSNEGCAMDGT